MHYFVWYSVSIGFPCSLCSFVSRSCLLMLFSCISIANDILRFNVYHVLNKHIANVNCPTMHVQGEKMDSNTEIHI